jgi:hypothetical protein
MAGSLGWCWRWKRWVQNRWIGVRVAMHRSTQTVSRRPGTCPMARRCTQPVDERAWEVSTSAAIPVARIVATAIPANFSIVDFQDLGVCGPVRGGVSVGVERAAVVGVRRWVLRCCCFGAMTRWCASRGLRPMAPRAQTRRKPSGRSGRFDSARRLRGGHDVSSASASRESE